MAKKPNKVLFYLGVIMIVMGVLLLMSLTFGVDESFFGAKTPVGSIEVSGISSTSATILAAGFLLIVLGIGVCTLAFKVGK